MTGSTRNAGLVAQSSAFRFVVRSWGMATPLLAKSTFRVKRVGSCRLLNGRMGGAQKFWSTSLNSLAPTSGGVSSSGILMRQIGPVLEFLGTNYLSRGCSRAMRRALRTLHGFFVEPGLESEIKGHCPCMLPDTSVSLIGWILPPQSGQVSNSPREPKITSGLARHSGTSGLPVETQLWAGPGTAPFMGSDLTCPEQGTAREHSPSRVLADDAVLSELGSSAQHRPLRLSSVVFGFTARSRTAATRNGHI
jgi:hypothetical protein